MAMKEIYLDNAAGTPVDPRVIRVFAQAMLEPGNPSSFNDAGRRSQQLLERARMDIAQFLNARADELFLYPSASDANAAAIHGILRSAHGFAHAITTTVEHRSIRDALGGRSSKGLTIVAVDDKGRVSVDDVVGAISRWTVLVSVMYANNEIGTVQPIQEIAKAIRAYRRRTKRRGPYFHVDASQAAGYLPMDVQNLGVDLLTFNGAKIYGPRGTGVLYVRRGVRTNIERRGEDVAAAVGLAEAVKILKPEDALRVSRFRDLTMRELLKAIPDARLNGPEGDGRLANNINISIPGATSEELLLELDKHGIRAGSGSACTAYSVEPSHVLRAIRTPKKYLAGALRFSLSRLTTKPELDALVRVLPKAIASVRSRHQNQKQG